MSHKDERKKTTTEWNAFQTTVVDPIVEALGACSILSEFFKNIFYPTPVWVEIYQLLCV